jgi:hypothetical protein
MINWKSIFTLSLSIIFFISLHAQPKQGQMAAEIALPSVTGDTVRLYDKFKSKGFEIYSVSLDDEKANWIKAIKKDKISWLQVIDRGGWETPTAAEWSIYALPTSYLLDKDGRLIAMDLEGKDLEKALKDMLDD